MSPRRLRRAFVPLFAAVTAGLFSASPAAGAPPSITVVPFVASDPSVPHRVWSGRIVYLKAVTDVQGSDYEYTWDYGDGNTAVGTVANRFAVTASRPFTGSVGTVFNVTLTVRNKLTAEQTTVAYPVEMCARTLDLEVQVARDEGLWYLHKIMNRWTPEGQPDMGTWAGVNVGTMSTNDGWINPAILLAFETNGFLPSGDPSHPYTDTVKRGFMGMWGSLYTLDIGPQTNGLGPFSPDGNGNGIAVRGYWDNTKMAATSFFVEAIVATGTPAAIVPTRTGIRDNIAGRTYAGIVQDMVDYYAYCQYDAAPQGGGWAATCNSAPSQSITQFAAASLVAARRFAGVVVPDIVRQWLLTWLVSSQDPTTGGFGSADATDPDSSYTGEAMMTMAYAGIGRGNTAWDRAETYMRDRFVNSTIYPPLFMRDFYALQGFVKALRAHDANGDGTPEPILFLQSQTAGIGPLNWYAARVSSGDTVTGMAGAVVDYQNTYNGYWTAQGNANAWWPFNTSWALCMLTGAAPSVASVSPDHGPSTGGTLVTVTGSGFTAPAMVAFGATWAPSVTVVDSQTIQATAPAHAAGTVAVRVRIADGQETALAAAYTYSPPPPPPPPDFTDDPLVPGTTSVRAVHVTELRSGIDQLRIRHGLAAFAWTDATLGSGTIIRAVHIQELRTALVDAYVAATRDAPTFSDASLTVGASVVRVVHIAELRAAVLALW